MTTSKRIYVLHGLNNLTDLSVLINIIFYRKPLYILPEKKDRAFVISILEKQPKDSRPEVIKDVADINATDTLDIYTFSKTLTQFSFIMRDIKRYWIKEDEPPSSLDVLNILDVDDDDNFSKNHITLHIHYFSLLCEKFSATKSDINFKFLFANFKKTSRNTFTLNDDSMPLDDDNVGHHTFFEHPLLTL
jgi:hypothetical protein